MYEILYPGDGRLHLFLNAGVLVRKYTTSKTEGYFYICLQDPTNWPFRKPHLFSKHHKILFLEDPCVIILPPTAASNKQFLTFTFLTEVFRSVNFVTFWAPSQICKKEISSSIMSVCPPVRKGQLGSPLTDFQEKLIFQYFSKVCRGDSSFISIWQE